MLRRRHCVNRCSRTSRVQQHIGAETQKALHSDSHAAEALPQHGEARVHGCFCGGGGVWLLASWRFACRGNRTKQTPRRDAFKGEMHAPCREQFHIETVLGALQDGF